MRQAPGFTLVELLITITVMGILLSLAVVNFSGSLTHARDQDRRTDVAAIAETLEGIYKQGDSGVNYSIDPGTYPTAVQMRDGDIRSEIFKNLSASGRTVTGQDPAPEPDSIIVPGSSDPITFEPSDVNHYAYIPLAVNLSDGSESLCEDVSLECRRFVIRYKVEAGGPTLEIRSRNQ